MVCALALLTQVVWAAIPATDNFSGTFTTNWTTAQGTFTNTGGVAVPSVAGENTAFWKTATDTFSADQSSQIVVTTIAGVGGSFAAVRCSGTGASTQCYLFGPTSGTGSNAKMYKQLTGTSYTQLGADYGAVVNTDTLKLLVVGTTLTPYINGVAQSTRSDSAVSTGQPGIWCWYDMSQTVCQLDNWQGDNNAAAAAGSSWRRLWHRRRA